MITTTEPHMRLPISVELGTFTLEGVSYTAMGSMIDTEAGQIVGYVVQPRDGWGRLYNLTTWHGAHIGVLTLTKSYITAGRTRARIYCWKMIYAGRAYHGRNAGPGLVLRLKASKS